MGSPRSAFLLSAALIVACGGSPAPAPAAAAAAGAPSILGQHQLLMTIEGGRAVEVAAEDFHFALGLEEDGTYHLVEWEHGAVQKEARGRYDRDGDRLVLRDLEPGTDFTLLTYVADDGWLFCFTASVEEGDGSGAVLGEHPMVEVTGNGVAKTDSPKRMIFDLGAGGAFAVHAAGSQEILHGTWELAGTRLSFVPEGQDEEPPAGQDGEPADGQGGDAAAVAPEPVHNAVGLWFSGKRLVLCRDLYRAARAPR